MHYGALLIERNRACRIDGQDEDDIAADFGSPDDRAILQRQHDGFARRGIDEPCRPGRNAEHVIRYATWAIGIEGRNEQTCETGNGID